jgi:hypothetical protein
MRYFSTYPDHFQIQAACFIITPETNLIPSMTLQIRFCPLILWKGEGVKSLFFTIEGRRKNCKKNCIKEKGATIN